MATLSPLHKTLKSSKPLTLYPITSQKNVPRSLLQFLHREFNAEIERGCTYPMEEEMSLDEFEAYWFGKCGVVALTNSGGNEEEDDGLKEDRDWEKDCLGTFYIKPNYPGTLPSPFIFV